MDKTAGKRQAEYLQKLRDDGKTMARFPVANDTIKQVLQLFGKGETKQNALHNALIYGLDCKSGKAAQQEAQQIDMHDCERIAALSERDQLRKENAALKMTMTSLIKDNEALRTELSKAQQRTNQAHCGELLQHIEDLIKEAHTEINAAASNPKTKQADPSRIPTWKNLHKFLEKLEALLND